VSTPDPKPQVSPEFFRRVNDFLAMAQRIAKRYTMAHAQMVLLHAFARYSAHHYLATTKDDSPELREEFGRYLGAVFGDLFQQNVKGMSEARAAGEAGTGATAAGSAEADATGARPDASAE